MSVRKATVPTLVLAALAAAAFFAFARSGPRTAATSSPGIESEASVTTADNDEVRRLHAAVREKERVIRALTNQAMASDAERAAAAAATAVALRRTSVSRAVEALDARLAAAPADAAAKAQLEQALRPAFESKAFGGARVDDVRCAGNLCKVALSSATEAELGPAIEAVAGHVPKAFPAMIAYPGNEGGRAIFVGRSSDDLKVAEDPASPGAGGP